MIFVGFQKLTHKKIIQNNCFYVKRRICKHTSTRRKQVFHESDEREQASYLSFVGRADVEVTQNSFDSHFIVHSLIGAPVICWSANRKIILKTPFNMHFFSYTWICTLHPPHNTSLSENSKLWSCECFTVSLFYFSHACISLILGDEWRNLAKTNTICRAYAEQFRLVLETRNLWASQLQPFQSIHLFVWNG